MSDELPVLAIWHGEEFLGNQYDLHVMNPEGKVEILGLASTYLDINRNYARTWLREHSAYKGISILCHLSAKYPRIW